MKSQNIPLSDKEIRAFFKKNGENDQQILVSVIKKQFDIE